MIAYYELLRENDNSIVIYESENNGCPPHYHSNIEIMYVVKGELNITINGQTKTLTSSDISIANSYDIHACSTPESSNIIVIIIPLKIVSSFTSMIRTSNFKSPFLENSEYSQELYNAAIRLLEVAKNDNTIAAKGYAYVILGILSKQIGMIDKVEGNSIELSRKILLYLQQNYLEDLSLDGLAKHLGYNKTYLSRFFRNNLGCGFKNHVIALRIRHALQLISEDNLSLTEIALKSGFANYRTFNRAFKSVNGIKPTEYKKSL